MIRPRLSTLSSWNVYESFPESRTFAMASPRETPERNPPLRRNLISVPLTRLKLSGWGRLLIETEEWRLRRDRPGVHGVEYPAVLS